MILHESHLNIFKVWKWDSPSEGVVSHAKERESIDSEYVKWVAILRETKFGIGLGNQLLKNPASYDASVAGDDVELRKHQSPFGHQRMRITMIEETCAPVSSSSTAKKSSFSDVDTAPTSLSQLELEFESKFEDVDGHFWSICILQKCSNSRRTNLFSISLIFLGLLRARALSLNSWLSSSRFKVKGSFFFFFVLR